MTAIVESLSTELAASVVRSRLATVPPASYRLRGPRALGGRTRSDGQFVIWEISTGVGTPMLEAPVTVVEGMPTRVELHFVISWRRHVLSLVAWPLLTAGVLIGAQVWILVQTGRDLLPGPRDPVGLAITFLLWYAYLAGFTALTMLYVAWRRGPRERRFVVEQLRALLA